MEIYECILWPLVMSGIAQISWSVLETTLPSNWHEWAFTDSFFLSTAAVCHHKWWTEQCECVWVCLSAFDLCRVLKWFRWLGAKIEFFEMQTRGEQTLIYIRVAWTEVKLCPLEQMWWSQVVLPRERTETGTETRILGKSEIQEFRVIFLISLSVLLHAVGACTVI